MGEDGRDTRAAPEKATGHRPYIMPDGSRLTAYLCDERDARAPRKAKKGRHRSTGRGHAVRVVAGPGAQESREEVWLWCWLTERRT